MNQYIDMFIEESKEHLQACNEHLLELEKSPNDITIVNDIFRSAHTLKGMSATMGYGDIASLTHQMENVLDLIRSQKIAFAPEILDVIFLAVDNLEEMVQLIADGHDGKRDVSSVVKKLKSIENRQSPSAAEAHKEVAASLTAYEETEQINYDVFERAVIKQAIGQGFGAYEIRISFREECLLKAVRVYMVFEVLEKMGEVIKSIPTVEVLQEEKFDQAFTVTFISKETSIDIEKKIYKVAEIEKVEVVSLSPSSIDNAGESLTKREKIEHRPDLFGNTIVDEQDDTNRNNSQSYGKIRNTTIRVNIERLDILLNLFEELIIDRGRLEQISSELNNKELDETVDRISRITGDLQSIILNMRMVPIKTVFNRFPRMVRQLSRDLHKEINFEIIGAETELDRTVIDEISDPLVHLIRNSVDHGIETPDIRAIHGKSEQGNIILKAYHSGNNVFVEIEDDGAGISRARVLQKAIENGIVTEQMAGIMTDNQVYELIFASGFSTVEKISNISGRGVGLDVVKNTIENLGGTISVDSVEGEGTIFLIQLPLTLSIISVLLVEIQKEKYAIPISSIIETAIINKRDILHGHSQKVIDFRGEIVPLIFLKDLFNVPIVEEETEFSFVVIVLKGEKMAGLVVDSFIGQKEIVLKPLGYYLTNIFAISGATILGNGQVALIIDCNALLN